MLWKRDGEGSIQVLLEDVHGMEFGGHVRGYWSCGVLGTWDLAVLVDYAAACMDIKFVPGTWLLGSLAQYVYFAAGIGMGMMIPFADLNRAGELLCLVTRPLSALFAWRTPRL